MNIYIKRAVKYFLYLIIMLSVIIGILVLSGYSSISMNIETLSQEDLSKFYILFTAIILLSALYPKLGYINKELPNKINKAKLEEELNRIGIIKVKESGDIIHYRYRAFGRRIMTRFDDSFTVQFCENQTIINGTRIMVSRVNPQLEYAVEKK